MRKWEDIDKHQTVATKEELSIIDTLSFLEVQRIKQGISQTEFAKKIGMTQPQLAKIENLDSIPTLPTLNKYAAGLLIDILIEQNINEEIEFHKDGVVYNFIPSYLTSCKDNKAYSIAYDHLAKWLENNPSYLKMADQLLIQQMFLALPLCIETDEAIELAYSILYKVYELMDDLDTFSIISKTFGLNYLKKFDIMM